MSLTGIGTAVEPKDDALAALGLRTTNAAKSNELGQSEFLELMTAQLQAQDPMEPMENGAFIGQLAQFSTVSGMDKLVATVETLAGALAGSQVLDASSLIGRGVLTEAPALIDVGSISERGAAVDVPVDAFDVRVTVEDASGRVLGRMELGDQSAGLADFDWSELAPASGAVRLSAEGTVGGERTELRVLAERSVQAVTLDPGGRDPTLTLSGGDTSSLDGVRRVF